MKKIAAALLLFFLFFGVPHLFAQSHLENCIDEICDGMDNDCDKAIDDFADCGDHAQCGCATCNKKMVDGKCAVGIPWQGFCLEDHCPQGTTCNTKTGQCRRGSR